MVKGNGWGYAPRGSVGVLFDDPKSSMSVVMVCSLPWHVCWLDKENPNRESSGLVGSIHMIRVYIIKNIHHIDSWSCV